MQAFNSTQNTTGSAETRKGVVHAVTSCPRSTPLCSKHTDLLYDFSKDCTAKLLPAALLLQLVHLGGLDQGIVLRKLFSPCSLVVEIAIVGFCVPAAVDLAELVKVKAGGSHNASQGSFSHEKSMKRILIFKHHMA